MAPRPAASLRPGAPGFGAAVARLLGLPLEAFAEAGEMLEVRVAWHPETLWFVPAEADAEALVVEGVSRGRVWTARELVDLLRIPGLTSAGARTVAVAKVEFLGEVTGVTLPPPVQGTLSGMHSEGCDCAACVP